VTSARRRIVVVGGSLAGLRAAEELRHLGFDGQLVVVGDEPHHPYDRPPLSKQVLAGTWGPERASLTVGDEAGLAGLDIDWRLGSGPGAGARALDLDAREVVLAGGTRLGFDGLVIATGATPRRLPGADALAGVHTLRTLDDCLAIRADLDAGARRAVVVGAGFIGSEVAATCRGRGVDVTILEALPVPLGRALGDEMGAVMGDLHRDHGVDLRLGAAVAGFDGDTDGRVARVRLVDGPALDADLVVVGIGVTPNTGWLDDSGLALDDGVVCDETTLVAPGVVAAGDVARWPSRRFGELLRVEHWDNAIAMGEHAAQRLLAGDGEAAAPYDPVPWFWSDQYDRKIQLAGRSSDADEVLVVDGSAAERRFVALYRRGDRLVGVLAMNRPRPLVAYRNLIERGGTWDDALALAGGSEPGVAS
jgi:NADPH-dependent 2,4-dienoyl-CoA reductase/sulfur reductase-like enzyme